MKVRCGIYVESAWWVKLKEELRKPENNESASQWINRQIKQYLERKGLI
jgi:hypothetical protein